jgi:hypothetical protein
MKALTNEGKQKLTEIAAKYNLSIDTVEAMARAVVRGNGTMAQFNIPELGGQGQWMKGGMTMTSDMFNNALKVQVSSLCSDLAETLGSKVIFEERADETERNFLSTSVAFWPAVFGNPTSSGAQNNFKYAYFGPAKRLVILEDGKTKIYDTRHHQISGVSQQQGLGSTVRFSSQDGPVDLESLELVSDRDGAMQATPQPVYDVTHSHEEPKSPEDIIIATIGKVNLLFEQGKITEDEFKAKKQELLAKL